MFCKPVAWKLTFNIYLNCQKENVAVLNGQNSITVRKREEMLYNRHLISTLNFTRSILTRLTQSLYQEIISLPKFPSYCLSSNLLVPLKRVMRLLDMIKLEGSSSRISTKGKNQI